MARDSDIIKKRNQAIKQTFYKMERKDPDKKYMALVRDIADMFWLAPTTVAKILNQ